MKFDFKRILIINLGGLGDILLSTPALKAIRQAYPKAIIELLVVPYLYNYARGINGVDKVYVWYKKPCPVSLLKNLVVLLKLRQRRFDLAVNMRTLVSLRGARAMGFLLWLINPGLKVGRDTCGRGGFLDIKIPESDWGEKYERDYDLETAASLGAQIVSREVVFVLSQTDRLQVDEILNRELINPNWPIIGIHPGGEPSRRWPRENFVELIKRLKNRGDFNFVVTGDKRERGLAKFLVAKSKIRVINLAGRLSISQLAALIERCCLYITNDTGPMHIAASLNVSTVAIFGPGSLVRYDPRNISNRCKVVYHKHECAPCNKKRCARLNCLKEISVEEVFNAASLLLAA